MTTSRQRTFDCIYDRNSGRVFQDLTFEECRFESCGFSITTDPAFRTTVRNSVISRCVFVGTMVGPAILDNIVVDNLKTVGLLQCRGTVFKRVIIRGPIGRLMVGAEVAPGFATPTQQSSFNAANREYYSSVDWALDISEAQFEEADLRGVPGQLVRRDPETQVLINRERLENPGWSKIDLSGTPYRVSIDLFLEGHLDSVVLIAPRRNRKFAAYLAALNLPRDAGFAE